MEFHKNCIQTKGQIFAVKLLKSFVRFWAFLNPELLHITQWEMEIQKGSTGRYYLC